jgi:hypothetical protein
MAALYAAEGHRVDERTIRTYLDEKRRPPADD